MTDVTRVQENDVVFRASGIRSIIFHVAIGVQNVSPVRVCVCLCVLCMCVIIIMLVALVCT